MNVLKMTDVDLKGKTVLIREDFNVPIQEGKIKSDARIKAAIPTIKLALEAGAAVILMSHLGRPKPDKYDESFSLRPVAVRLSELLNLSVLFAKNWRDGVSVNPEQVVLCENTRFHAGEKKNDDDFAKKIAALCDVYVNDAFAVAHREEASTSSVTKYAKIACAGPLLIKEISALDKIVKNPIKPVVAVVGGAKVSTKLKLLQSIAEKVDTLIVGGGIANTFLAAAGYSVGKSLIEPDFLIHAKELLASQSRLNVKIPLPEDVVVGAELSESATATVKSIDQVEASDMILDLGPKTINHFSAIIKEAKTILWNGPLGVFEIPQFSKGTEQIGKAIAQSAAYSLAGGGETIEAIEKHQLKTGISYISTAGGAFLTYLEGSQLPALVALEKAAAYHVT